MSFFTLNTLCMVADPVLQERAQKLEAMSRTYEDKLTQDILGNGVKRSNSLDRWELWTVVCCVVTVLCLCRITTHRKSVAILS